MIPLQDLGNYTLADEDVIDVQAITDAMMTPVQSLTELGLRFFLNVIVCWVLVQFFYYRKSRRRDYYFTFMIFSTAMLMLLYIMGNVEVGVGLTLGLFAIFGVIRYRTETVPIREMTYLFVIIALAAMNGLAPFYKLVGAAGAHPHYELSRSALLITALSNALVVALVWVPNPWSSPPQTRIYLMRLTFHPVFAIIYTSKDLEETNMTHIKTIETRNLCDSAKNGGCGECQTSCQSACKTSCGIANQQCEKKQDK